MSVIQLTIFHERMFAWWRKEGRVLPWREKSHQSSVFSSQSGDVAIGMHATETVRDGVFQEYFATKLRRDPYRVVVAEIMLQQTQVDRVLPKYNAWMEKWPSIDELAKASLAEVIIQWKGLGYNRRARFLWLLSKEITENRNGVWPRTEKELIKLPGIGRYTARAIMSFALGEQVGVVDVNVKRVISRIFADYTDTVNLSFPSSRIKNLTLKIRGKTDFFGKSEKDWVLFADSILPVSLADPWNQALMDFGALVCTAKSPKCELCPVADICRANQLAIINGYANYNEYVQKEREYSSRKKNGEMSKKGKDYVNGKKLKFQQTDRFLRGRIVDLLRDKEWKEKELIEYLSTKYTQFNTDQILFCIGKLAEEKIVQSSKKRLAISTH